MNEHESIVTGNVAGYRGMADGCLRVTVDVPGPLVAKFHELFTVGAETAMGRLQDSVALKTMPKFREQKLSVKAHGLINNPDFQKWIKANSAAEADEVLKVGLGIESKSELDSNPVAAKAFNGVLNAYLKENVE